jgi:hypothetical protein
VSNPPSSHRAALEAGRPVAANRPLAETVASPVWGLWQRVLAQVEEIRADGVLRAYGAALALTHLVTALFWWQEDIEHIVHRAAEPICWPLVPACDAIRLLSIDQVRLLLVGYGVAALVVASLFRRRRLVGYGFLGLVALTALKILVLALDYRLRRNQHYMALWVTGVFLAVPGKREALRLLLVLFYVWAGTLKLNWEWISGAGLYRPLWLIHGRAVIAACVYVIVLELVVSWGLLARRPWIFWSALAQIALFHVMSWPVVGFFYPVLMFVLLTILLLDRLRPSSTSRPDLFGSLWTGGARAGTYAVALAFSLCQLVPYAYHGDRAITGEGRLYALHMFDARIVCQAYATVQDSSGAVQRLDLRPGLPPRMDCDPHVLFNRARNLCVGRSEIPAPTPIARLDLQLLARRSTEAAMHEVINVTDFCNRGLRDNPFRHNDWITTD